MYLNNVQHCNFLCNKIKVATKEYEIDLSNRDGEESPLMITNKSKWPKTHCIYVFIILKFVT